MTSLNFTHYQFVLTHQVMLFSTTDFSLKMEQLNPQIINDLNASLKLLHFSPQTFCEEMSSRRHSDRFRVNIYEKPKPIERRPQSLVNQQNTDNFDKNNNVFCRNINRAPKKRRTMEQFENLKSRRDVECLKMKEASNILRYLNEETPYGYWFERLMAEKILLTSGTTVDLLNQKIHEDYIHITSKDVKICTVCLENFKFYVNPKQLKSNETEFFVMIVSSGTDVKSSKIARCCNDEVIFNEKIIFDVKTNFKIKVQLYSIIMKEGRKYFKFEKFFPCHKNDKQISKISYKNINTSNYEKVEILKTSFKFCSETEVNPSNFHNKTWELTSNKFVSFSTKVESFSIDYHRSGFLTIGSEMVWNRRWCKLDGQHLKIYNSPNDEDLGEPLFKINLENCLKIAEASRSHCSRPRCLLIEFSQKKYFFMADNSEDLHKWINDLNVILEIIKFKNVHEL